ncbi:hypothetical protein V493_05708 [Pseudogymnoascus sp. VKM F-4281 (FW-2241)]|nr:hypothetical protein V493_05708 [Pseudogymnoascus sp. VKM F-4281 (FW-2241)]
MMHFNVFVILGLASIVSTSAIPEMSSPFTIPETSSPLKPLSKRATYHCKGDPLCGHTANLRAWCDIAVNEKLTRDDVARYGARGSGLPSGSCVGNAFGFGCGVYVQGNSGCKMTGNEIWLAYQDIRKSGCRICGQKDIQNGCFVTINRVSRCF